MNEVQARMNDMKQLLDYYQGANSGGSISSVRDLKIANKAGTASRNTPGVALGTMLCPKCGKFKKSRRASCCAPGGAWENNCGGVGNRKFDHSWLEGAEACKCKSKV